MLNVHRNAKRAKRARSPQPHHYPRPPPSSAPSLSSSLQILKKKKKKGKRKKRKKEKKEDISHFASHRKVSLVMSVPSFLKVTTSASFILKVTVGRIRSEGHYVSLIRSEGQHNPDCSSLHPPYCTGHNSNPIPQNTTASK